MRLALALAAATLAPLGALAGGCKPAAHAPPRPTTIDERQACTVDADCAVVELGCCDHCNGGQVAGVHKDFAAEVHASATADCGDTACTLMACVAQPTAVCAQGMCGVAIDGQVATPPL